ncbi:MAG: hypothetical protein QOK02_5271, partial [Mycobacterium sp.]|nr:hypothetical protein [Mycobacterium sp.]
MSELFAETQTRRALVVWLVLVAATIVSWTVG